MYANASVEITMEEKHNDLTEIIALLLLLNYKVLKIYSYDNSLKSGHRQTS